MIYLFKYYVIKSKVKEMDGWSLRLSTRWLEL